MQNVIWALKLKSDDTSCRVKQTSAVKDCRWTDVCFQTSIWAIAMTALGHQQQRANYAHSSMREILQQKHAPPHQFLGSTCSFVSLNAILIATVCVAQKFGLCWKRSLILTIRSLAWANTAYALQNGGQHASSTDFIGLDWRNLLFFMVAVVPIRTQHRCTGCTELGQTPQFLFVHFW